MSFSPSVFIGVGGVGKNILLRIRRMIIENHQSLATLPSIRFIHLDTDLNSMPDGGSSIPMTVLGESLAFTASERCEMSARITQEIAHQGRTIAEHPAVKAWFDPALPLDNNFRAGAGGIRPYGRLAFQYSAKDFRGKLSDVIHDVVNHANRTTTGQKMGMRPLGGVNLYIACSLLGGTGSGAFLEVCYNARVAARDANVEEARVIGTFVIGGNVEERPKANCYSALMELEYHSTAGLQQARQNHFQMSYPVDLPSRGAAEAPVDLCYLCSPAGQGDGQLDRNAMEEAIALNLYLEFGSPIAQEKRARRVDYMAIDSWTQVDPEMMRSRQFASFGITCLEFPAPRVQEMLAYGLASVAVKGWLFEKRKQPDLKQDTGPVFDYLDDEAIKRELLGQGERDCIKEARDRIAAQQEETLSLSKKNPKEIDAKHLKSTVQRHREWNVIRAEFSQDERRCGEDAKRIDTNAKNLKDKLEGMIAAKMHELVENEHRGPSEALRYLTALQKHLQEKNDELKKMESSLNSAAEECMDSLIKTETKLFKTIGLDKFALDYHIEEFHSNRLSLYMNKALHREVHRAAICHLTEDRTDGGLVSSIEKHIRRLEAYKTTLVEISSAFAKENEEIKKTICIPEKNGGNVDVILQAGAGEGIKLSSRWLEDKEKTIIPNAEGRAAPLLDWVIGNFAQKNDNGETILPRPTILDLISSRRAEVQTGLLRKCREMSQAVRNISIADILVTLPNLKNVLTNAVEMSQPLLSGAGYGDGENIKRNWLGTAPPNENLADVCREINAIHQYTGAADRHFQNLPDAYRIVLASEKGLFPLRRITMLEEYRRHYRHLKPAHCDIRIHYPDILPLPEEEERITKRAARAALLGRLFGFLEEGTDENSYPYIRLYYFDEKSLTNRSIRIADNWEGVEAVLSVKQKNKEIDRTEIDPTDLEQLEILIKEKGRLAVAREEREKLWLTMQDYLKKLEGKFRDGDANKEYQRQRDIIQAFRDEYSITAPVSKSPVGRSEQSIFIPEAGVQAGRFRAEEFRNRVRGFLAVPGREMNREAWVRRGVLASRLDTVEVSRIVDEEMQRAYGGGDLNMRLAEYTAVLESILECCGDRLSEDDRLDLKSRQSELNLTDEQIREIEKPHMEQMYLKFLNDLKEGCPDGVITVAKRNELNRQREIHNLTEAVAAQAESPYGFRVEE